MPARPGSPRSCSRRHRLLAHHRVRPLGRRRGALRLRLRRQGKPRPSRRGAEEEDLPRARRPSAERQIATDAAHPPANVKDEIVRAARLQDDPSQDSEEVVEFSYRPGAASATTGWSRCARTSRSSAARTSCSDEYRYFFSAPRGALTYPLRSRERLEVISLGPMAYPASKDKGDNSMPLRPALVPRRTGRGDGGPA